MEYVRVFTELTSTRSTVIDSFDIVIDWNLDLIAEQLENVPAKAKVVVELPGGMGGSGYFIRRLKKRFLTRNIIVKAHSGYVWSYDVL